MIPEGNPNPRSQRCKLESLTNIITPCDGEVRHRATSGVSRDTCTNNRHPRLGFTWCCIGRSVRDIKSMTCHTSPAQGVHDDDTSSKDHRLACIGDTPYVTVLSHRYAPGRARQPATRRPGSKPAKRACDEDAVSIANSSTLTYQSN